MCPSTPFLSDFTKTSGVLLESWAVLSSIGTPVGLIHPRVLRGSGAILDHVHLPPCLGAVCSLSPPPWEDAALQELIQTALSRQGNSLGLSEIIMCCFMGDVSFDLQYVWAVFFCGPEHLSLGEIVTFGWDFPIWKCCVSTQLCSYNAEGFYLPFCHTDWWLQGCTSARFPSSELLIGLFC